MGNKNAKKNATGPLNEKEIQILMANTGLSRQQLLDWHRKFLTDYRDGFIDKKEFTTLYKQLYSHGNPAKFAEFAFKAFDDDHKLENFKINKKT